MILYSQWINLPLSTRYKIASEFGIPKKNPTHVVDNVVKDDGYLIKDIESAITMNSLQKYFNTAETDLTVLWFYLVDKMEGKNVQLMDNTIPVQVVKKVEEIINKKRGRPSKK